MKLITSLLLASALITPMLSFAQSSQSLTRAQVRADLVQFENAGYYPSGGDQDYPQNIQAAAARIAMQNQTAIGASASSLAK
jgi:hypothetical protein